MPRWLLAGLLFVLSLLAMPVLRAQDKKPAAPVTVTWHGHSFFTVQSSKGTVVAFDPHAIQEYGRRIGIKADLILMSHQHNDHTQVKVIENYKEAKIIPGLKGVGQRADWNHVDEGFKDVHIRSVGVYHDNIEGMRYGKNTIFLVEMDGWRIAHLGDLGHSLTPGQLKRIGPVDVLMVPVGGIYALNGSEAKEVVAQIKPKEYIFPTHLGTKVYTNLLPVDEFLQDQEGAKIAKSDDNKIILNRDPQRPRPLIVLLHWSPKGKQE
ncbi:MAG: MBL fold metallo-hydrolase [Gemmataceae bacterium]|nr:MBL fold metallo-hydrolase [Gemmataceae bacterium]MCI0739956.1 MBL fold metallo-hydrolase [Gemmataceae bacterium]